MQISVDELVENPKKYLNMVANEDIYIAKNGEDVAKLTKVSSAKKGIASKLFGILPKDADLGKSREERLSKI